MSEMETNAAGPEPTDEEQDVSLERLQEEEAERYPAHDDPQDRIDPDPDEA